MSASRTTSSSSRKVKELLDDDGVMLLHSIGRMEPPGATNTWLRKYIFPGGYTPALSEVLTAIEKVGLWVTDIEILRLHYAETLRHWRQRFLANRERIKQLAGYDERFCRMWEFYLAGCEIAFRYMNQMVFQIQLARRQDAVPLTRDYMVDAENGISGRALDGGGVATDVFPGFQAIDRVSIAAVFAVVNVPSRP